MLGLCCGDTEHASDDWEPLANPHYIALQQTVRQLEVKELKLELEVEKLTVSSSLNLPPPTAPLPPTPTLTPRLIFSRGSCFLRLERLKLDPR